MLLYKFFYTYIHISNIQHPMHPLPKSLDVVVVGTLVTCSTTCVLVHVNHVFFRRRYERAVLGRLGTTTLDDLGACQT